MKRLVAFLTLLLWSISMTVSASAEQAVLCVEKSGKTAIEYSSGIHCEDNGASTLKHESSTVSTQCVGCVDRALAPSANCVSPKQSNNMPIVQMAIYIAANLDIACGNATRMRALGRSVEPPLTRSSHIGHRASIVLQQ